MPMVHEFFYVTRWANAYMYIISSMTMSMYVPSLYKDFIVITLLLLLLLLLLLSLLIS